MRRLSANAGRAVERRGASEVTGTVLVKRAAWLVHPASWSIFLLAHEQTATAGGVLLLFRVA